MNRNRVRSSFQSAIDYHKLSVHSSRARVLLLSHDDGIFARELVATYDVMKCNRVIIRRKSYSAKFQTTPKPRACRVPRQTGNNDVV